MASTSPTNTNSSPKAISFKDLPWELRQLIYPHALELQPGLQAPPLLLALASEPHLYEEAREVYKRVNFVLNYRTEAAFRAMAPEALLEIPNLTVVWERDRSSVYLHRENTVATAIGTLYGPNNLETITFDLTGAGPFDNFFIDPWIDAAWSLIIGAEGSVHKSTLIVENTKAGSRKRRRETRLLQLLFVMLGLAPRQQAPPPGTDFRVWVWEGNGSEMLTSAQSFTRAMINPN